MFCYSQIVPGVYVLLLTDCTGSLCFVTNQLYMEFMFCYADCTWSLCFITNRLYLEFMFCYSQIVPGVYVLLLTNCTQSLCFVTHKLYPEFMFCYSPIVPGVSVLLLTDYTGSLSFITHRLNRVICCIWYVYETDPIPVKFRHIGNELYIDIRMFGYYHHICMHNAPLPPLLNTHTPNEKMLQLHKCLLNNNIIKLTCLLLFVFLPLIIH